MSISRLLVAEIIEKYHDELKPNDKFHVYCSPIFHRLFFEEFLKGGFIIDEKEVGPPDLTKTVTYQLPEVGFIKILPNLEEGYKIIKI